MRFWQFAVHNNYLHPSSDALVVQARAAVDILPVREIIDGSKLQETWREIVHSTHPVTGQAYRSLPEEVFEPINLDDFLAVRCRAVSALERHGPNINGDAFPTEELMKSFQTFIGKGFYIEHRSFHPINAVGIIPHAEWMGGVNDQFVNAVPLIDKKAFPREADEIRERLTRKNAGVSMGCIAASAECSICGNVARNKNEICGHMQRGHHMCVKGKRISGGSMAYDLCRGITFYELSYTKLPADRDALGQYVFGADFRTAEDNNNEGAEKDKKKDEGEKPAAVPAVPAAAPSAKPDISVLDPAKIDQMVQKAVERALTSRVNKLIKTKIDQTMGPILKQIQLDLKPSIEQKIEEKKEVVEQTAESRGGD